MYNYKSFYNFYSIIQSLLISLSHKAPKMNTNFKKYSNFRPSPHPRLQRGCKSQRLCRPRLNKID